MNPTKVEEKIKNDIAGTNTFLFINPEPLLELSPSIPEKFPKELIPKELCESQINDTINCLILNKFDNAKCEDVQGHFYICKKWRDGLLFNNIQKWEISEFNKWSEEDKKKHLESLNLKKNDLLKKYETIEVIGKNKGIRVRVSSDIQQLMWRIEYLKMNQYI
jgi:hypothetical protein